MFGKTAQAAWVLGQTALAASALRQTARAAWVLGQTALAKSAWTVGQWKVPNCLGNAQWPITQAVQVLGQGTQATTLVLGQTLKLPEPNCSSAQATECAWAWAAWALGVNCSGCPSTQANCLGKQLGQTALAAECSGKLLWLPSAQANCSGCRVLGQTARAAECSDKLLRQPECSGKLLRQTAGATRALGQLARAVIFVFGPPPPLRATSANNFNYGK